MVAADITTSVTSGLMYLRLKSSHKKKLFFWFHVLD